MLRSKNKINYIFFTIWFLLNGFLMVNLLFYVNSAKLLFFIHGLLQIIFEISLINIFLICIEKIFKKKGALLFSSLLLLFFILKYIHFFMQILMDNSVFFALNMIFGNGFTQISTNLKAANLNIAIISIITIAIGVIPFISVYIYNLSHKKSNKTPLHLSLNFIFQIALISLISLFSLDMFIDKTLDIENRINYRKKLPYNISLASFFQKEKFLSELLKEKLPLKESSEKIIDKTLNMFDIYIEQEQSEKINIFLFVIESLRKDLVTKKYAPTLYDFKINNIHLENSLANANGTIPSWFSIFYSRYPLNISFVNQNYQKGSTNLKIFKKLNFNIHVCSSADFNYFHMDKTLFGKNNCLLENSFFFTDKNGWERDSKCFNQLEKLLLKKKIRKNNLFLTFLDSTHSEYEFPNSHVKFTPISETINYISLCHNPKNHQILKNRYLNSLNYIDSLFSKFFEFLKKNDLYENSIIVITGDHGEEFFEEGSFFHGTHLNNFQLSIPILFKIPGKNIADIDSKNITSLVDIFPTIFDIIDAKNIPNHLFHGKSIFKKEKKSIQNISASNNGGYDPEKIALFYKNKKYILQKKNDLILIESKNNLLKNKQNK